MQLTKIRELTVKDFEKTPGGVEFNGTRLNCVASFYETNLEDKYVIEDVQSTFNFILKQLKEEKIDMELYLRELGAAYKLSRTLPNVVIGLNDENRFIVKMTAKLKEDYKKMAIIEPVAVPLEKEEVKPVVIIDYVIEAPIKAETQSIFSLYAIQWEESERGWGIRPDGYSFHKSSEDATKYLDEYWSKQPKDHIPDEYSRPLGEKAKLIEVSKSLYDFVMDEGSVWLSPNSAEAYKDYDASCHARQKIKP